MTDYQGPNDEYFHAVREEKNKYKDVHFQLVSSGVTFGRRFISHMLFAVKKYDFDYFLRVDDDYFLCFENILLELPTPSLNLFHWGWVHRHDPIGLQRAEESLILFSRDVIETFLLQDPMKMFCHPLADQMIAKWLSALHITTLLRHDDRIHHDPPVGQSPEIFLSSDICQTYIAVHGSYPDDMKLLWTERGTTLSSGGDLEKNSLKFPVYVPFNWRLFDSYIWRYQPKLCIDDPIWDTSKQMDSGTSYTGREGDLSISHNYDSKNSFEPRNDFIDIVNQKFAKDNFKGEEDSLYNEKELIKNSKVNTNDVIDKKGDRFSEYNIGSAEDKSIEDFLNHEDNMDITNILSK